MEMTEEEKRAELAGDVQRLLRRAGELRLALDEVLQEAEAYCTVFTRTQIVYPPTGQRLNGVVGIPEELRRRIGDRVGEAAHPLRVAMDRVGRRRREFKFSASSWPRKEPEFDEARILDNFTKHETVVDVYPRPANASVTVTKDRPGGTPLYSYPEFVPVVERRDREIVVFQLLETVPKPYRTPSVGFQIWSTFDIYFGDAVELVGGQSVRRVFDRITPVFEVLPDVALNG